MKKAIKKILSKLNYNLIKKSTFETLMEDRIFANEFKFILNYPPEIASKYIEYKKKSKAQLKQDLFVLNQLNYKKNGYFVEFGATDGISMSNTYLLEKEFNWNGILSEPAKCWHKELRKNRNVFIEEKCVWKTTNEEILFNEVKSSSLSTIVGFGDTDSHSKSRENKEQYTVKTISLLDLLRNYNAPNIIDYLSIDTEGSEYVILNNFDFEEYCFKIITVEHNYTPHRKKIFDLLTSKGYKRLYENYSMFDDWYVLKV